MIRAKSKLFTLRGVEYGDAGSYSYYRDAKGKKKKKPTKKSKQAKKFAALYGSRECRGCPFSDK